MLRTLHWAVRRLPAVLSLVSFLWLLSTLTVLQDSEDIRYMVGALKALGIQLEERWEQQEAVVVGCGGRFPVQGAELFLGNAGTAMRCAAAAIHATPLELGPGGPT